MYLTKLASIQLVLWNILEKHHENPEAVFKHAKLNPSLMHRPGERYPLKKIAELWNEMERRIIDPCFGLSAAICWHPSHFGSMGYAMLVSKTLRITLERLIRFHRVISDADFGELHEDSKSNSLFFTLKYTDESQYSRGREDAALAWIVSLLRVNYQKDLSPTSVWLTHDKPDCKGKYYEFFQCPVHFNSQTCRISLSLDVVDHTLASGNEKLAHFADEAMARYLESLDEGTNINRIKKIIVEKLPSGNVAIEKVAKEIGINSRKLQRMLQEKDTTFSKLLDETREDIAVGYIADEHMDLTEIAFLLGFSELSTFSRSFKRWTGKSPLQYRKSV